MLIPLALLLLGTVFGFLGLTFTLLAPTRDYLNYYTMLLVEPMFMFSNTFFPISGIAPWLQSVTRLSPLTHAVALIRGLAVGQWTGMMGHFIWLLVVLVVIAVIPIQLVEKKLVY